LELWLGDWLTTLADGSDNPSDFVGGADDPFIVELKMSSGVVDVIVDMFWASCTRWASSKESVVVGSTRIADETSRHVFIALVMFARKM